MYLLVGGAGKLFGVFANTTGDGISTFPLGATNSSNFFGFHPRCLFSADLNNGTGGFLVIWHQTENGTAPTYVHSIVFAYPTGPVTSEKVLTDTSDGGTNWTLGPTMAYSSSSHQFLVAWTSGHFQIQGRLVDASGNPVGPGSPILVAKGSGDNGVRDAGLGWNPATHEFGLANTGWQGSGFFVQFRRFKDTDASASGGGSTFAVGAAGNYMGTCEVNLSTNHYVVGWTAAGAYRAEFDQDGTMLSGPGLIATNFGSYDSLSIAFNPQSGTFLAVGHDPSGEDAAIELDSTGAPIGTKIIATNGAVGGSFYPRAVARSDAKQWGMSYARNFKSITSQIIATNTSSGPPPPPPGAVAMVMDTPSPNALLTPPVLIAGWAVDSRSSVDNGIDTIHVWAVPTNNNPAVFVGIVTPTGDRDDVAQIFGQLHKKSGFGLSLANVPPGQYTLVLYPHSSVTGDFDYNKVVTRSVSVTGSVVTHIATPGWGQAFVASGVNMVVSGYAINLASPSGTGIDAVHVWAIDPFGIQPNLFLGAATLGVPDAAAAQFGQQFANGGYSLSNPTPISPGMRYILVYSRNAADASWNIARFVGVFVFQ